jgi:hypothetical protein
MFADFGVGDGDGLGDGFVGTGTIPFDVDESPLQPAASIAASRRNAHAASARQVPRF